MCLELIRTYRHLPARELKRLARSDDDVAQLLYKAVAYGASLRIVLAAAVLGFGALSVSFLCNALGVWLGVPTAVVLSLVGVWIVMPAAKQPRVGIWLAKLASPGLAWLLERMHPILAWGTHKVRRLRPRRQHTGLFDKSDIAELLEQQKGQPDSRIDRFEINLLLHALEFGDKLVRDTLTPKRDVRMVAATESIGPILMQDLHDSGHTRFPVFEGKRDNIVGLLYLHDIIAVAHTGVVSDVTSHRLSYVHEDFTLRQTLNAFLKTKQQLFVVVNSDEQWVGIITIEDILEQIVGRRIPDSFDHYEDRTSVAHAADQPVPEASPEPPAEAETTTEAPEVVK